MILSRRSGRSLKFVNPYFSRKGSANVGFRPRTLATAERCIFYDPFLSEPARKCNLAGAGRKSWLSSASSRWSASVSESSIFGAERVCVEEFRRPIRIPTTNSVID